MSLQHVYRRGHIFWWRRAHTLFDGPVLDVRISLRTSNRLMARNLGAALTASSGSVLEMLNKSIYGAAFLPTEAELQSIAKNAYNRLLMELCTQQRSDPRAAPLHSANNHALIDYYQRLCDLGGHASLLPGEEHKLAVADGWDQQRIEDLRMIIELREEKGITRFGDGHRGRSPRAATSPCGSASRPASTLPAANRSSARSRRWGSARFGGC